MVGCRTYAPKPPQLAAHYAEWMQRGACEEIAAFGESLRSERELQGSATESRGFIALDDAEGIALLFNADLRLARAQAGVTGATLDHAGLWDDPMLHIVPERMLSSGAAHPWSVMASIGLTLPISGRLEVEKRRAGAAHHAALHEIADREWQVRMDLRRAWIAWSAATLKRDAAAAFLEQLVGIVGIADRMQEVGELAPVHARLFHIEQHQRRNQARAIEADEREGAIALRQLMGLPPQAMFLPNAQLVFASEDRFDDTAERIRLHHPRIQSLLAQHETAERALELAVRKQYPDIELGPGYNYEDGGNRVLLGVSLPLPIFNRNQQEIAEREAERERSLFVLETTYERLLSDFAAAQIQLDAAREQLAVMREHIVPMVDRQYADARRIAELGEVDTLLLLDTLRRQFEAKLELIELEAKRSLASVRITELLGPDAGAPALVEESLP